MSTAFRNPPCDGSGNNINRSHDETQEWKQAAQVEAGLRREAHAEIDCLRAALREIDDMPFSMFNDVDSLRHTIRIIQQIAHRALNT